MDDVYDVIIVGGGCAGYPAAVYAKRFNLKTLVITKLRGGLITTTHLVENYPGFTAISGPELGAKLEEQVKYNNVPILDDTVVSIEKFILDGKEHFKFITMSKKEFISKTVILATGTKHRHLDVPGEKEFTHKGVSYCATCDGPFYRNKEVVIVGGSDSAAKEAMVLSQICSKVTMLVRSHLKAEPINADRLRNIKNVEIKEGVQVQEICGDDGGVTGVTLTNGESISADGVFIAIGMLPQNELAKSLGVALNQKGEIIIDRLSRTNLPNVFAAGDVTDSEWKQGIIGSAEGSVAAYSAFEYLRH
jgi:thioredoxin-disulfide reductase